MNRLLIASIQKNHYNPHMFPVIEWKDDSVVMLDQRLLPAEEKYVAHHDHREVARSIREMLIRGAPAIGIAAAMGIALGVANLEKTETPQRLRDKKNLEQHFQAIVQALLDTRPTAVSLFRAAERMRRVFAECQSDYPTLKKRLIAEALAIDAEDVEINKRIGENGQVLLKSGDTVLTHCNAGALATGGYGTALGVVRAAKGHGKKISVMAGETRPYLQGARLTVWELQRENIPVTLITDSMAAWMMKQGRVQAVIVGADRIAANGDTANKIGTYALATLARAHALPFYVAASVSTIDFSCASGSAIPIEERSKQEVTHFCGQMIARPHTSVHNPAFDVTPANLITAIITEEGVLRPDYQESLAKLKG